ncbi:hypothetical protein [Paraburkholderia caribensis]|uniref:hypothetical protein n=1 Tax=Paraburkholderia caribensis TaxID=75105 RepID=UPI0011E062D6|nr:hypothetical protein [Paraburkholderia caribensis]
MDVRGAYINSLGEEVKEFRAPICPNGWFRLRRRKMRGGKRSFAVTLPDMENGSLLRDRVESGTPLRAVSARAASKAKKQLLI